MVLDLRTLYVVASLTLVVLGIVQFAAYATGRFERWPLWWSWSNLLTGLGTFCIALRDIAPDHISVGIANTLTLAGYIFMLVAVRVFAGRPIDLRTGRAAILFCALTFGLAMNQIDSASNRVLFGSVVFLVVDVAVLVEALRLVRRENLWSARLLVGLYSVTSLIFAVRAVLAMAGVISGPVLFEGGTGAHSWLVLTAVLFIMMRSMVMLLMASERSHNELVELAHHDLLTGVLNRTGLARALSSLPPGTLPVLLIDIDHFKTLNDRHGHRTGDAILRLLAEVAAKQLGPGDLLARHGGDEFVVLIAKGSIEEARATAERIRLAFLERITAFPELTVHPTLSIGIAACTPGGLDLDNLLHKADEALYRSKREGRNRVAIDPRDAVAA